MRILAFDTAGGGCSACLWQNGTVLAETRQSMDRGQAEALVPLLSSLMAECGFDWPSLDRVAVTVGPGSFTGVRVGLATARALALAADLPVVGVSTLDLFAAMARDCRDTALPPAAALMALVDARRDDFYCQVFSATTLAPITTPDSLPPEQLPALAASLSELGPIYGCGDARSLLENSLAEPFLAGWLGPGIADPVVLAQLASQRPTPAEPPSPLYIRPPDAALPVNGGQLRPAAD